MKKTLLAGMALTAMAASAAEITKDWAIVTPTPEPSGISRAIGDAAGCLRDAIEEGVGFRLNVVSADKFKGGRAIYLGAAAAEKAGLMPKDLTGLGNVYAEKGGDIYLFGRDASGRPQKTNVSWSQCVLPTVKATVRFMEDVMDVRFIAPGRVGVEVPACEKIALKDGTFSRHLPRQIYGTGRLDDMMYDYAANIFGNGKFCGYGGHSYPFACPGPKYFKEHPEYFAYIGGKRQYYDRNPSLCISNPAVEDLMVEELCRRFDEGVDVCQLGQQDGGDWCQCEKCRAFLGTGDDWSEKIWLFHCRIAERLEKLRPGKIVHIMSYGLTKNPPKSRTRLPSNVMVELCHLNFDKWAACEVPHGFTVYTYVWGDYQHLGATPKHSYAFLADYAVNLVTNGVRGVYRCGFGELFGTEGPGYYVFNNKLEKPEADVESLVREYCARAYGPAASAMRRFHDTLDHRFRFLDRGLSGAWRNNGSENGVVKPLREVDPVSMFDLLAYVYTSDTIRKLDDALTRAEGTKGLTAKQKTRLMVVRREYDYARSMGRLSAFYAAYGLNPSHEAFGRMADEIEHRNALVAEIVKGQSYVPRLPEWPELRFFGSYSAYAMKWNVRWATGAPLCWDVASLRARGVLPGAKTEKLKVKGVDTAPTGLDFERGVWASAPWTPMVGCQLQDEKVKARFKILAGPKALHVAVETDLDDGVPIKPTGRDWQLWIQDTLELMIDPTGSRDRYFHFIWNPVEDSFYDAAYGLVTDTLDPKFKKEDRDWNGDFSYETTRGNGVWRTVANVPYASLQTARPTAGEKWAFNIGRVAKQKGESDHLLIWNPNLARPALGDADALGILEFE